MSLARDRGLVERHGIMDLLTQGTKPVDSVSREVIEANVSLIARRMEQSPFGHAQS